MKPFTVIPYGRQSISQDDIDAVVDVLRSDYLTQGPVVPCFEETVARYCSAAHAVAVNSATSALHLACLALSVGPGDLVWTSPVTFVASANCALYCGAQIDFVDIDPRTFNMSPEALEQKLVQARREGQLPKAVIPVHMCGQSCDMAAIHALSKQYGFHIIEDASHAIGARYQGEPIGNCRYSDIVVFSFHPVKIITTGEGGMALTNNEQLVAKLRLLRTHGITHDSDIMAYSLPGPWYYEQLELGFNYRMTDLQAALGLSQMARLDAFVARRHELATQYDRKFANLAVITPWQHPDSYSSFHLYVIQLQLEMVSKSHRDVFVNLRHSGIGVNLHYIPVYHQPYYRQLGFEIGYCRVAEQYYSRAISLPLYPDLNELQQNAIVEALMAALH
jgi:UDP-4-amino-4,6-dideoxy-N-acetyl-beta-L-altrosamine transaminase